MLSYPETRRHVVQTFGTVQRTDLLRFLSDVCFACGLSSTLSRFVSASFLPFPVGLNWLALTLAGLRPNLIELSLRTCGPKSAGSLFSLSCSCIVEANLDAMGWLLPNSASFGGGEVAPLRLGYASFRQLSLVFD